MKLKLAGLILLLTAFNSHAIDWGKQASDLMGGSDDSTSSTASTAVDYAKGLLPALKDSVGVSSSQAEGGAGSIFSLVTDNLSTDDFSSLAGMVPGLNMDSLIKAAPAVAESGSSLTGMLGSSGGSIAGVTKVYDQFKSLGLSTEQLTGYVTVIKGYLQSEGGESAVDLFKKGAGSLAG
jgi:hypothetical protein